MKKNLLLAFTWFAFVSVMAQTEKGSKFIGVDSFLSIGISTANDADASGVGLRLGGLGGYFVADNLMIGGILGFSAFKSEGDFDADISGGPIVRYYHKNVFVGASVSFSYRSVTAGNPLTTEPINYGFELGYAYLINKHVAIEPKLQYNILTFDGEAFFKTFSPTIGFAFYLP